MTAEKPINRMIRELHRNGRSYAEIAQVTGADSRRIQHAIGVNTDHLENVGELPEWVLRAINDNEMISPELDAVIQREIYALGKKIQAVAPVRSEGRSEKEERRMPHFQRSKKRLP